MNTRGVVKRRFHLIFLNIAAFVACFVPSWSRGAAGDLYASDSGFIYRFTPAGDKTTFASGSFGNAMAFDRMGNLVTGISHSGGAIITKFAPDGTGSVFATIESDQLLDLAVDGADNLFVSTGADILKIAPDGTQSTFIADLEGVWALAFDKLGNLYAAINASGANSIMKFTPDGSGSTFTTFSGPGNSVTSMA